MMNGGYMTTEGDIATKKQPSNSSKLKLGLLIMTIALFSGLVGAGVVIYFGAEIRGDTDTYNSKSVTVDEESATIAVASKVSPSVVSITSKQTTIDFFGQSQTAESSGTGYVVTSDGLIATNKHVASNTSGDYTVFTSDGKEYSAKVKAIDPYFDIAFLKIEASGLTPLALGDSDSLKVGQHVVAIGNALGQYQNTVTTGVISAIGRSLEAGDGMGSTETLENMIQTDAAINSGNSGGPLTDVEGQVIGMNTAVAGEAEGIGFAIPVNLIRSALESVQKTGAITRPYLGVRYININKAISSSNKLGSDHGALIYSSTTDAAVVTGSPAAKAGLKAGDIITKIGNKEINEGQSLIGVLSSYNPKDKVSLVYLRDGNEKTVTVVLGVSN